MVVIAIIGILAVIAIQLYADFQQRTRTAKAQADARTLASAISMYSAHTAKLPAALNDLMLEVTNDQNQKAGPFMNSIPAPPQGWGPYAYAANANGTFSITTKGEGTTVSVP